MRAENKTVQSEDKDLVERIILGLFVVYTIIAIVSAFIFEWSLVVAGVLLAVLPVNVYMYINKAASYRARACFMTAAIWFSLTIYGLNISDFIGMLISLVMVTIVLAYYGLPEVFYIGNFFYTVLVAVHLFVLRDVTLDPGNEGVLMLIRILTVYIIQTVAWKFVMGHQERNKRQTALIESLRRAEQSKDDFLANVSHEIRTPVNTICGMSEIVLLNELPGDVRNYIIGIQTAGYNLLAAVSDILDFAELQSGKMGIVEDEYSITSVVNDIINIANAKNSHKSLELVVDCDPAIPALLVGDRQKISRAIRNVMDNAIKFTEAGGVVLSLTSRKESYGANLCVTVKDTGIGIRPEDLERIFTSFNQVDTRRNRMDGGIGLGLAISRMIAEKMGGFIHVKSTYGEGTEVIIVIPQKVADETPCIVVKHPEEADILIYLRVDKYTFPLIRDSSRISMERMAARFGVSACFCRNIAEVRRRMQNQAVTHLFVGWEEYCEDRDYFEKAAGDVQTILIVDRDHQHEVADSQLLCVYAPVYALAVASILNEEMVHDVSAGIHRNRFTAPDAHVLVVDDNMMNLKVVEGLLRPYQIKVTAVQSGKEALNQISSKAFDFIFMDHMMPEMDGVETFRRIRGRSDSYSQTVPIIALTANAVGNAREMFLSEGFSDYLPKPIEMSALEQVLRKFIPKHKIVYAGREIPVLRPQADPKTVRTAGEQDTGSSGIKLLQTAGIDTVVGITYCGGNETDYLEILRVYCEDGEKNVRLMKKAVADEDRKQLIILAHTLKSTSKSIGAVHLSELAKELETDGKAGRLEHAGERTGKLLEEYARILQALRDCRAVFPDEKAPTLEKSSESSGTEMSREEFSGCCERLRELIGSFNGDAVAEYMMTIGERRYRGRELTLIFGSVCELTDELDFIGAEEALTDVCREEGIV